MQEKNEQIGSFVVHRRWDPNERDSFGRFINMTDQEVTTLLIELDGEVGKQGEYDQDDVAVMPWDKARDLLMVADTLWSAFRTGRLTPEQPDAESSDNPSPSGDGDHEIAELARALYRAGALDHLTVADVRFADLVSRLGGNRVTTEEGES